MRSLEDRASEIEVLREKLTPGIEDAALVRMAAVGLPVLLSTIGLAVSMLAMARAERGD